MYKTIKLRLKATKNQKEHLLVYEETFHMELDSLIRQMHKHPNKIRFMDLCISDSIEAHSRWFLYQSALKAFKREKDHKKTVYGKSSTWSPRSISIKHNHLTLFYGKQFQHKRDTLIMKPLSSELLLLEEHVLIRMDLVHDEFFWYANFLIQIVVNE